ncbi:MAG: hypothetical protein RIQ78_1631, partial [Bacteroidota bacterium]
LKDLVKEMVESDLSISRKQGYLQDGGFETAKEYE